VRRLRRPGQVARYRRWQQEGYLSCTGQCVGITAGTARALAVAQWRQQPFSGSHDPEALDPEVLSRVAPVAMYFFAQPAAATERAAEAARTTCQAPAALSACRALAQALHAALSGEPRTVILERAQSALRCGVAPDPGHRAPGQHRADRARRGPGGLCRHGEFSRRGAVGRQPRRQLRRGGRGVRRAGRGTLHCKCDPHFMAQQP